MPCLYSSCVHLYNLLLCSMKMYWPKSPYKHPSVKQNPLSMYGFSREFYFESLSGKTSKRTSLGHCFFVLVETTRQMRQGLCIGIATQLNLTVLNPLPKRRMR